MVETKEQDAMEAYVAELVRRAKAAQALIAEYTQEQVDELVGAVAYRVTRPELMEEMARFALEDTGLGDYESKYAKIEKKIKEYIVTSKT